MKNWSNESKRALLTAMIASKGKDGPELWQSFVKQKQQSVDLEARPMTPPILASTTRSAFSMTSFEAITTGFPTISTLPKEGLIPLALSDDAGRSDFGLSMTSIHIDASIPPAVTTPIEGVHSQYVLEPGDHVRLNVNTNPWRTTRMVETEKALNTEMHIMALSQIEASEADIRAGELVKRELGTSGIRGRSSPSAWRQDLENGDSSTVVTSKLRAAGPPRMQLTRGNIASNRPQERVALNQDSSRSIAASCRSPIAPSKPRDTAATQNRQGPSWTTQVAPSQPVEPIEEQPAKRRRILHVKETSQAINTGTSNLAASTEQPPPVGTTAGKSISAQSHRLSDQTGLGSLSPHSTQHPGRSLPNTVRDLFDAEPSLKTTHAIGPPKLRLPRIDLSTLMTSAQCTPIEGETTINEIKGILVAGDWISELLNPALADFNKPDSPVVTPVGCQRDPIEVEGDPKVVVNCNMDDVIAIDDGFESETEHMDLIEEAISGSPIKTSEMKVPTYMPVASASGSKIMAEWNIPLAVSSNTEIVKKARSSRVVLQDGGSLEDIVKSRLSAMAQQDTEDDDAVIEDKIKNMLKSGGSDIKERKLDPIGLGRTKSRPAPSVLAPMPAVKRVPVKKSNWRENKHLRNPAWYDKMVKTRQATSQPTVTALASLDLLQDRPLTSQLEKAGFRLMDSDLPYHGADLILSAKTSVIFRPIQVISDKFEMLVKAIDSACDYFDRVLLVFDVLRNRRFSPGVDGEGADPLTPALIEKLPNVRETLQSRTMKPSDHKSKGRVEVIVATNGSAEVANALLTLLNAEVAELGRRIGSADAMELGENRDWLDSNEEEQIQWLAQRLHFNSFSAAYVIHKCGSVQAFLLEYTEEERMALYGAVIGEDRMSWINRSLRTQNSAPVAGHMSSDPLNLRPPSSL
ncbi:hypothetical protein BD324DRAFT_616091 [Kockovaella imperatae]|uniref:Uncharacterized protein n=1 Tax=Kockovaella imperatae TaxID=4999 RepID=A0A1Y1US93_9TREE|nr:hypothetical protein BD324DRAFT_616091 [Kockovaella imperatae]ORX40055.1 hypothetical protein BD324DRAFT_616091 [Kockovaella imperatae]